MPHALLVEDDRSALHALAELVEKHGFSTTVAGTWAEARAELVRNEFDVALLDVWLPGGSGLDLLLEVPKESRPQIVLMSGEESVRRTLCTLPMHELHFIPKPIEFDELSRILTGVKRKCRHPVPLPGAPSAGVARLIGESVPMRRLRELIRKVAPSDLPVYIEGASGTGKELVARAVHELSRRKDRPFVAMNCGAIPETLIDSELFGYEKGAFTGAGQSKGGVFEQADGGTLFLDEIAEMPVHLQVRLLRTLETKAVRRVGGSSEIEVDVRIVSATNRRFDIAVASGQLREDLFHRLCVFPIAMPPLRERNDDVVLLAEAFLRELIAQEGRTAAFDDEALAVLRAYSWPGNVRQLRNVVQRAYVIASDIIRVEHLPEQVVADRLVVASEDGRPALRVELGTTIAEAERRLIEATLRSHGGNKRTTADVLGVSLRTLYNRLNSYADASADGEPETD